MVVLLERWRTEVFRVSRVETIVFIMYQSKSKEAGEAFGLHRFEEFINAYGIFLEVIEAGKLGGMRFTACSF